MAAAPDTINAGKLAVIGFAGIVFTYIVVLLLQGLYFREVQHQWREKVVAIPVEEADSVLAEQMGQLRGYGVVDPEAGTYHVPIEQAMQSVAAEIGQ